MHGKVEKIWMDAMMGSSDELFSFDIAPEVSCIFSDILDDLTDLFLVYFII